MLVFDGWVGLFRVAAVGTVAYLTLVLLLRISGKRTLSKMDVFDLVVTVALGSTLATVLLSPSRRTMANPSTFDFVGGRKLGPFLSRSFRDL